jgi:hypothetical protein
VTFVLVVSGVLVGAVRAVRSVVVGAVLVGAVIVGAVRAVRCAIVGAVRCVIVGAVRSGIVGGVRAVRSAIMGVPRRLLRRVDRLLFRMLRITWLGGSGAGVAPVVLGVVIVAVSQAQPSCSG